MTHEELYIENQVLKKTNRLLWEAVRELIGAVYGYAEIDTNEPHKQMVLQQLAEIERLVRP